MNEPFTLIEAEKAFKAYGCTHFHMFRDEPELYAKYESLNISKELEREWTRESFIDLCKQQTSNTILEQDLWWKNSRSVELATYLKDKEILNTLYESSFKIFDRVPPEDAIKCAESILDRRELSTKRGTIFLSLELEEPSLANKFLELADKYIAKYDNSDHERRESALQRAKTIRSLIGVQAPNKSLQHRSGTSCLRWTVFKSRFYGLLRKVFHKTTT